MNRAAKDASDEVLWGDAAEKARRLATQLRSDAETLADAPDADAARTSQILLRTADAADELAEVIGPDHSVTDAPSPHDRSASPLPGPDPHPRN